MLTQSFAQFDLRHSCNWLPVPGRLDGGRSDRRDCCGRQFQSQRGSSIRLRERQHRVRNRQHCTRRWQHRLGGERHCVRLFQRSIEEPIRTSWRHLPDPCVTCAASVIFGTQSWPRPGVNGRYLLCLNCGRVTVNYTDIWRNRSEATTGSSWTPACPSVLRLRDAVYRHFVPPSYTPGTQG